MTGQDLFLYHVFGPSEPTKICSEKYIKHFGINECLLYGHVNMCTWVTIQSPCIYAAKSSTEGKVRAAGDSCLPFIVAHEHSGIFLGRSDLFQKCTLHKLIEVRVSILPYKFCVSLTCWRCAVANKITEKSTSQ